MRLACLHQWRIGRQLSQLFIRGSLEGKTIHTGARYLCNILGLEIWVPWPPEWRAQLPVPHRLSLHSTVQYPTEICLETGSILVEISARSTQADLPNGKKALPSRVSGSVQNPGLPQLHDFFTQAGSPWSPSLASRQCLCWDYPSGIPVCSSSQQPGFHLPG